MQTVQFVIGSAGECASSDRGPIAGALRALLALLALSFATVVLAASNVVEYTYDAAGNIKSIKRQVAPGFAITSFDPESGPVGTVVTIFGTGFSATPASNVVRFNGTQAVVTESNSGSISTTVPAGATNGRITVTLNGVTATSAQDFFVVVPGAPTVTSFTPASGVPTDSIAVTGTNFAVGATTVKLNGVTATANIGSATALTFTVPAAAASGRITATTGGGTGASANDFLVAPPGIPLADVVVTRRLVVDGGPSNVAVGTPSKHALILFDGTASTYYTLQFGQIALNPSSASVAYKVVKPDNTVLVTGTIGSGAARPTIHLPLLPATGTYSVVLSPGTATLNTNARVDADPIVAIDGVGVASGLDTLYQSKRFVIDLAANQRIGIGVAGVSPLQGTANLGFRSYLPNGTAQSTTPLPYCHGPVPSNLAGNCGGSMIATVAGRYTLVAENPFNNVSNFTLLLSNEVTGTLAADVAQVVTLTRVGQDGRYAFTATAGESLSIDLSSLNPQPQTQTFYANVYDPAGTYVVGCSATAPAGGYCDLGAMAAGTYSVHIDPQMGAYGDLRVTLKKGAILSAADPPSAFAPSGIAEVARYRFTATAGQNLSIAVSDLAYVGSSSLSSSLAIYRPDRTAIGSVATCTPGIAGGRCRRTLSNLPLSGTYSVVLSGPAGIKVTGNIVLSDDLTGTLVAGTPQVLSTTRSGQNARYAFAGTAGESTSVKLFDAGTTPAGQSVYLYVYKPDGAYLTSASLSTANATVANLPSLPATGTYTALVESWYGHPWQGRLALDPGTPMTVDVTTATLTTSVAGEPLRYRFPATAGQRLEFGIQGLAYAAASGTATGVVINRPDGPSAITASCYATGNGGCESWSVSLPVTGTYSMIVSPPSATNLTGGTLALSTPVAGTFVVGAPAQSVAIARPGQTLRYTFSGTAAQLLRLHWSGAVASAGSSVSVYLLKPDGTTLSSSSYVNGATGSLDIASLPTTGTYTVVLDPSWAGTTSATMSLVTR